MIHWCYLVNFAQNVPFSFGYITFLYPNTVEIDTHIVKFDIYLMKVMRYNTSILISA